MKTYDDQPNFSVYVPGPCNANCKFCYNKDKKPPSFVGMKTYLENLSTTLATLPTNFNNISFTGGEPLLFDGLDEVLETVSKFKFSYKNIVLTTNGTNLLNSVDMLSGVVDHINVSRHHYNEAENSLIFSGHYDVKDCELFQAIEACNDCGIDVSANCVITNKTTMGFVEDYISWAHGAGFSSVRFRKVAGSLNPTTVEKQFTKGKFCWEGSCPVCRTKSHLYKGIPIIWKAQTVEPSETLSELFELIFAPDGKAYSDWAFSKCINFVPPEYKKTKPMPPQNRVFKEGKPPRRNREQESSFGGCGSKGCGG